MIPVPFTGEGSGAGELTWAQHNIWKMMGDVDDAVMVGGAMRLEDGTTLEHLTRLLAFVVGRHQSLRTRIRLRPDGTPEQVLADHGEVGLLVVDTAEAEDPAEVAEAVRHRFEREPYDAGKEWPVRMAVIRHHGEPSHFAAMYPHIVIDGYGFEALVADLANLDRETGAALAPRQGVQPLDLARIQQTPAVRRQGEASIRYWERLLREIPMRRFNGPYPAQEQRWWDVNYDSRAAHLAATAISARTGLHSGPILLAAYAVTMARITGVTPSVIRTLVSNRFRPDFSESVSVLVQPGLCAVDVADCTFDEAAQRAWRAQLATGKHSYYDPRMLWELMERTTAERGELDLMLYFNDGRRGSAAPQDGPPTPEQLWDALPDSRLTWGPRTDMPDAKAYLDVLAVPDTVNVSLRIDTASVSVGEGVRIVRGVEEVLLAAAFDGGMATGISAGAALAG